jgi:hypothetical protein
VRHRIMLQEAMAELQNEGQETVWAFKFSRLRVWSSSGPDDGGSTYLWNVGRHSINNTAVHPRRFWASSIKTVAMPPISKTLKPNITATRVVQGSCSVRHKVRAFIGSSSSTSSQPVYSASTF